MGAATVRYRSLSQFCLFRSRSHNTFDKTMNMIACAFIGLLTEAQLVSTFAPGLEVVYDLELAT